MALPVSKKPKKSPSWHGFCCFCPQKLSQEKVAMGIGGRFFGAAAAVVVASVAFTTLPASAGNIHTSCIPVAGCSDNGNITPVSDNTPNFAFHETGGSDPGYFFLEVLIPDNVLNADNLSITVNGVNTAVAAVTPGVFSTIPWTSDKLDAYLGIAAQPNNPIGAYLPLTQAYQPSATGYFVYQYNFGAVTFGTSDPTFSTNFALPVGTVINGFFNAYTCDKKGNCGYSWLATPNSQSLIITDGTPPPPLPEPATLSLVGAGLLGVRFLKRKRKA
jgi:hypothetical protein